jgi:hypothetical protein
VARQYEGAALRKAVSDALDRDARLNKRLKDLTSERDAAVTKAADAEAKLLAFQVAVTKAAQEALVITPETGGRVAKFADLPGWKHEVGHKVVSIIGDGDLDTGA